MGKEEFKVFVRKHPEFINYIENNTMTWQKFYEIYDLYGEDNDIWNKYTNSVNNTNKNITKFITNINTDELQKHIESAQKALAVISELTTKKDSDVTDIIKPMNERPIIKFFGD